MSTSACSLFDEPNDYVDRLMGDGNDGPDLTTGWRSFQIDLGTIQPGSHKLILGGYNNRKTQANEWTEILLDNIVLSLSNPQ